MRIMPQVIEADKFLRTPTIALPTLSADRWNNGVRALVARDLTPVESARCDEMARHNWSLIVVAEEILGREFTPEEVESRKNW